MSNNALISPQEEVYNYTVKPPVPLGYRVADTSQTPFEVAPPLFWVSCADDVVADQFYYDPNTQQINSIPQPPTPQPKTTTTGATVV
jgi:hypothetical protein